MMPSAFQRPLAAAAPNAMPAAPAGMASAHADLLPGPSRFAMYCVALAMFLNITRLASIYGAIEAMQLPLLSTGLAAIVMFAQARRWRPSDLASHWIPKLVVVIIVMAVAGVPTALHRGASFDALLYSFSQTITVSICIFGVSRTEHGSRFMVKTLAVAGVVTAALAVLYGRRDSTGRLAGAATYDSNDLGLILVVSMPLVIWWFFDQKSRVRWIIIAALPLLFNVMLRTSSRGGFLGMVAILAGLLFVGTTGRVREVRRIALTGVILALIAIPVLPAAYMSRMSTMDQELDNQSPRSRIQVWKRGIGYTKDNPLLGVGIGNFGRAEGLLSDFSQQRGGSGVKWSTAHSSYIQSYAELGVIGGTAFTIMVLGGALALMWWKPVGGVGTGDASLRMMIPMVGIAMTAFAVSGAFLSFAYEAPAYYLLGLGTALLLRPEGRAAPGGGPPVPGGLRPLAPRRPQLSRFPAPPVRVPPPRGTPA